MSLDLHENVTHFGFTKNLRLSNDEVELVIPTEYGPRIMHYALRGHENVLAQVSPHTQRVPTAYGDDWHIYGGHRLWYAPEHHERSYYPDNLPVSVKRLTQGVRVAQAVEPHTGLAKEMDVALAPQGSKVRVTHRLTNRGAQPIELAPWALTAMRPDGLAMFPHVPFAPHPDALAPARALVLWPFTKMSDPRWIWGDRFFFLRQDRACATPQKVGCYDPIGALAYQVEGQLFLKRHRPRPGPHADLGCNVQTFTNELFLELETLGPLVTLAAGQQVEHEEIWSLLAGMTLDPFDPGLYGTFAGLLAADRPLEGW
jgi:hypothetical protein